MRQRSQRRISAHLSMIQGRGGNRATVYNCAIIERARAAREKVRILQGGKEVSAPARMVHRHQITATYGAGHGLAEQGKYIDQSAISGSGENRIVTGAQHVNPYLVEDGSYHAIVAAFHKLAGRSLNNLVAKIVTTREDGEHLEWNGRRVSDDALVVTDWVTMEELWNTAQEVNSSLVSGLRRSKSQRDDVNEHLSAKEKFAQNVHVLRRSRRTFRVATGETELGGGATPYSMPLEQCGFAIDMYYMTTGFDNDGNEVGEFFFRMAYGRSTPWSLYKRDWAGLGPESTIAYRNERLRQRASQKVA